MKPNETPGPEALPSALRRLRLWARIVLAIEIVLPALLPGLLLIGAYAALGLFGLPQELPGWAHSALLGLFGLTFIAVTARGFWRVKLPDAESADRRLEHDSGLSHAPLRVISEKAEIGSDALWALHVRRAHAQLNRLRAIWPRPTIALADSTALRALVVLVLAVGVGIAGVDAPNRLLAAFQPDFTLTPSGPGVAMQAWIAPPSYTGMPPLVLKPEGGNVKVPEFSSFSATISGLPDNSGAPSLQIGSTHADFGAMAANSFQINQPLTQSGHLTLRRNGREMVGWNVVIEPDIAPVVSFPEPPGGVVFETSVDTRLPWKVSHRYGVSSLRAELHLAARPGANPIMVPIPLSGAPKEAHGAARSDLSPNPWAGLRVVGTLIAKDVAGREARSEPVEFTLPERRFRNKLARAVVAVRRQLSLTPAETGRAAETLDAIGDDPEAWADDTGGYLNLAAISALLRHDEDMSSVPEAQERLWTLALHLEEGAPDRTQRALEAARRDLGAQLAQKPDDNQAGELPHSVENLADALKKRLDALSQEARRDPDSQDYNPDAHPRDTREMQRLTDALREAAKQGKRDIAKDLLAELDKKLQALKGQRAERSKGEAQQAEKRQRGKRQLSVVQDMVQREGGLLDHSQFRPLGNDTQQTAGPQREDDHRVQLALRRALGVLMENYGDLTGSVPPNLGEADQAMRDAAQALARADDTAAAMDERHAIAALQQGGRDMRQQMSQQFGQKKPGESGQGDGQDGQDQAGNSDDGDDPSMAQGDGDGEGDGEDGFGQNPGGQPGDQQGGQGRQHARRGLAHDPLGRAQHDGVGGDDEGDVAVPEQMEQARTRELQEELRRRGADRTRKQDELDYIDRLLKQF